MLLDTHALLWLANGENLSDDVLNVIADSQAARGLYVSPISGWELALAAQKPRHRDPPDLGGRSARDWFREALAATGAKLIPITQRIAFEAADVAAFYARKDPGDCHIIATAHVRRVPIVTRDSDMADLARERPDYLSIVRQPGDERIPGQEHHTPCPALGAGSNALLPLGLFQRSQHFTRIPKPRTATTVCHRCSPPAKRSCTETWSGSR